MEFRFEKSFVRDFKKVKDKSLAKEILECIQRVSEASSVNQISNIKKITGYKSAYRIRTGNYRIGIVVEKNTAIFVAFDHRKNIYRKFPK
jgi:mRNA interferase RelE/StbE